MENCQDHPPIKRQRTLAKYLPSSYRPIAILPTISKIVERAAQTQLSTHLEENGLLNPNCHAYRTNLSTTTTIIEIMEGLYTAIDNKQISQIMTIDQSSAFDCVGHSTLLKKLKMYGLDTNSLNWVRSYLQDRSSYVQIGNCKSKMVPVSRGVPQGSVLGPLLYLTYLNEMTEIVRNPNCNDTSHQDNNFLFGNNCQKCGTISIYADDTTYRISHKTRQHNQLKIRENLDRIGEYLNNNDLIINMEKTKTVECMIVQKRCKIPGNHQSYKSRIKMVNQKP